MAENDGYVHFSTDSIHTKQDTSDEMYQCHSVVPPIYLSAIYKYPDAGEKLVRLTEGLPSFLSTYSKLLCSYPC